MDLLWASLLMYYQSYPKIYAVIFVRLRWRSEVVFFWKTHGCFWKLLLEVPQGPVKSDGGA